MKNKDSRLKVMHIVPSLNIGGRERVVMDLVNNIDRNSFCLSLCCLKTSGPMLELLKNKGTELYFLNKRNGVDCGILFRLSKLLIKEKPDIVHTHNPGTLIYGSISAKLAKIPVIINTEHGYGYNISFKKKVLEKFLVKNINKIISVSEDLSHKLVDDLKWDKDKIVTIHNGIDCEWFSLDCCKDTYRQQYGFSEKDILIGNIARLAEVKDHRTLIDAFRIIADKFVNAKLLIVGDGDLREELEKKVSFNGLDGKVIFLGERKDIKKILSLLDVFVLSSISEGISITLLEAMASGKPAVATNVGGNPEIIIDGETGVLVPVSSPDLLGAAIEKFLINRSFAQQINKAAREHIKKYFNIITVVKQIEELYKSFKV